MKKVFLGGTWGSSKWRDELIAKLTNVNYFNPIVDDWNEEAQQRERFERENDDYVLYVITPKMEGVYSIAEVIDDSNKRPEKTLFCVLYEDGNSTFNENQKKSLEQVKTMVERNGGKTFNSLIEIACYLNTDN